MEEIVEYYRIKEVFTLTFDVCLFSSSMEDSVYHSLSQANLGYKADNAGVSISQVKTLHGNKCLTIQRRLLFYIVAGVLVIIYH